MMEIVESEEDVSVTVSIVDGIILVIVVIDDCLGVVSEKQKTSPVFCHVKHAENISTAF